MNRPLNTFGQHTRSTAFQLSLSQAMVQSLIDMAATWEAWQIEDDLATRFDWYGGSYPRQVVFGRFTDEDLARGATGTQLALWRRGLIEPRSFEQTPEPGLMEGDPPDPRPDHRMLVISEPGLAVVEVLVHAGFDRIEPRVRPVGLHPDDRPKLTFSHPTSGEVAVNIEPRHDRRADLAIEGDERYFAMPKFGQERADA